MAPRQRVKYKDRPRYTFQDSIFLDLPREVRDLIYPHALTKSEPIDLWPGQIVSDEVVEKTPILQTRLKKRKEFPPFSPQNPRLSAFRDQKDLQWVRKELAVGLLSTCTQVYDEAWRHFWSNNTWRFSHDAYWIGVRRFLTTIGPRMRKSLRNIQVLAAVPGMLHMSSDNEESKDSFWFMCNHPKLRMAKIYSDRKVQLSIMDNMRFVGELLALDGPDSLLQRLTFVVPEGFGFGRLAQWDTYNYESIRMFDVMGNSELSKCFTFLPPLTWLKKVIIIEAGARLEDDELGNTGKLLRDHGIEVVCQAGSILMPVTEPTTFAIEWRIENNFETCLEGLCDLFVEPPEICGQEADMSPARKARTKRQTAALTRELRAFGGCRFERRKMWMRSDWDIAMDQIPEWWIKERPNDTIRELVFVNVKNPNRAHKKGIIIDPGRAARGWWTMW